MQRQNFLWEKDGYRIRPAQKEDVSHYYLQNYCPLDGETAYLTGSKPLFTQEEVSAFFLHSIDADDRYFFLILAPDGQIIGESVINEIDWALRCANFRIAIFQKEHRNRGIGSWATALTRDFAFEVLKLHRLSLEVYSFNPRAEAVYAKAGFRREGILKDAYMDKNTYADIILMAILESDWQKANLSTEE